MGSRPKFRDGRFRLGNAGERAGYHLREHQQFAVDDRNRTRDEQELAARESLNSTWTCARNLTQLTQLNRGLLPPVRSREQYAGDNSFLLVLNAMVYLERNVSDETDANRGYFDSLKIFRF
jgi:hypothetical protein